MPTAYFVRLRLPRLAGIVEFITRLPLVIRAIAPVFEFIRLYGSSSVLPLTSTSIGADALLMFGYVGLGLYEPSALAVMAFALTWGCLGLIRLGGEAVGVEGKRLANDPLRRKRADFDCWRNGR